jgi:hypothetical protein
MHFLKQARAHDDALKCIFNKCYLARWLIGFKVLDSSWPLIIMQKIRHGH